MCLNDGWGLMNFLSISSGFSCYSRSMTRIGFLKSIPQKFQHWPPHPTTELRLILRKGIRLMKKRIYCKKIAAHKIHFIVSTGKGLMLAISGIYYHHDSICNISMPFEIQFPCDCDLYPVPPPPSSSCSFFILFYNRKRKIPHTNTFSTFPWLHCIRARLCVCMQCIHMTLDKLSRWHSEIISFR